MRLPGSRYQEHGWERVRKLLAHCALPILRAARLNELLDTSQEGAQLDWFCEAMALALHGLRDSARCRQTGNSYGDSVQELAQILLCELRALPGFWGAFLQALRQEKTSCSDAALRKKLGDMFSGLRDRVDADQYSVATGLPCSANKIYTWRMLDTASHEVARILQNWPAQRAQIEAILQRPCPAQPIEAARLRNGGPCRAEWIIAWSASLEEFAGTPGPLHTKSKRFASLKNQPDKIASMLEELHDYGALTATMTQASWEMESDQACEWLEDYWRIMQQVQPESAALTQLGWQMQVVEEDAPEWTPEELPFAEQDDDPLQMLVSEPLEASEDASSLAENAALSALASQSARLLLPGILHVETPLPPANPAASRALCEAVSLPPDYLQQAQQAEDRQSLCYQLLAHECFAVRLSVYLLQLGAQDDSYPAAWLDPRSGQLPNCKQLAALAQVSLPTLRKRRALALQHLLQGVAATRCPPPIERRA